MNYEVVINGERRNVEFKAPRGDSLQISATVDGRAVEANAVRISRKAYSVLIGGRAVDVTVEETPGGGMLVCVGGREYQLEIIDPRAWRGGRGGGVELEGRQQLIAPMPGKIVRVLVEAGQQVETGQGLVVIEAMKMQNEVRSPKAGIVEKVVQEGITVNAGEILVIIA